DADRRCGDRGGSLQGPCAGEPGQGRGSCFNEHSERRAVEKADGRACEARATFCGGAGIWTAACSRGGEAVDCGGWCAVGDGEGETAAGEIPSRANGGRGDAVECACDEAGRKLLNYGDGGL